MTNYPLIVKKIDNSFLHVFGKMFGLMLDQTKNSPTDFDRK
jgi:hypothetical protein